VHDHRCARARVCVISFVVFSSAAEILKVVILVMCRVRVACWEEKACSHSQSLSLSSELVFLWSY